MNDDFDDDSVDKNPGPEITLALYLQWRDARRGKKSAERLTNPVWDWLIRTEQGPYEAAQHFSDKVTYPKTPRWCFSRFGMSRTELADGRTIFVAGEHEDYYDPDFFIYNDVIVRHPDGSTEVFGYPVAEFPPTDFHSATLVGDNLYLLGNLGYPEQRKPDDTAALVLDVRTLRVSSLQTLGENPGWIFKHQAELTPEGILIRGGDVQTATTLENIDDWLLDLDSLSWKRLTDRRWTRIEFRREDANRNRLWELRFAAEMRDMDSRHPLPAEMRSRYQEQLTELAAAGYDIDGVAHLYRPGIAHEFVPRAAETSDEFRTHRIKIGDVVVRYVEDSMSIVLTIEGPLPAAMVDPLANDLHTKLQRVENTAYVFRRW